MWNIERTLSESDANAFFRPRRVGIQAVRPKIGSLVDTAGSKVAIPSNECRTIGIKRQIVAQIVQLPLTCLHGASNCKIRRPGPPEEVRGGWSDHANNCSAHGGYARSHPGQSSRGPKSNLSVEFKHSRRAKANPFRMDYQELNDLIVRLRDLVEEANPRKGYWKELWSLARQISDGFHSTRFLTRADKDQAWTEFQAIREEANQRSAADRARIEEQQKQWENRQHRSSEIRSKLIVKTAHTRPSTEIERAIAAPILLPIQLIDAALRKILGLEDLDAVKEELQFCSEHMREAWQLFTEGKSDLLPADKAYIYKLLSDAQARLDAAWSHWKDEKSRLFTLKKEAWERRKQEREEKHQQFGERVTANIEKLEAKLEGAKSALERNEAHLEKLRDDYNNAWSDSFRERCSEWIEECEEKAGDIQASIERMETWLSEERSKLR